MFRPLLWPSSWRRIAKDGYLLILQMFVGPCADFELRVLTVYVSIYGLTLEIQRFCEYSYNITN
jgi:hypothetical protein